MTNKEMKDRLDAIEDLVKRQDGESLIEAITRLASPQPSRDALADSVSRLEEEVARLQKLDKERLESFQAEITAANKKAAGLEAELVALKTTLSQGAGATAGSHDPAPAGSTPAPATTGHPSEVPDTDPNDRRPAFHPEQGWRTEAVVAWAARRRAKTQPAA